MPGGDQKNMNMIAQNQNNKIFLSLFLALGTLMGATILFCSTYSTRKIKMSPLKKNALCKALAQEEHRVWQNIEQTFNISRSRIETDIQDNLDHHYNCHTFEPFKNLSESPQHILQFVQKVLKRMGVHAITFKVLNYQHPIPACAVGNIMLINEKTLKEFSPEAQEFIIAHEYQHIKNFDGLTLTCLSAALGIKDIKEHCKNNREHPLYHYIRFTEWRADIQTLMTSVDFIHGYKEFNEHLIKKFPQETAGLTHPTQHQRLYVVELLDRYNKQKNII